MGCLSVVEAVCSGGCHHSWVVMRGTHLSSVMAPLCLKTQSQLCSREVLLPFVQAYTVLMDLQVEATPASIRTAHPSNHNRILE